MPRDHPQINDTHTHTHTHTHRKLQRITIVLTHVPPPPLTVVLPAAEIITSVETLVLVTPSQMHSNMSKIKQRGRLLQNLPIACVGGSNGRVHTQPFHGTPKVCLLGDPRHSKVTVISIYTGQNQS